jgi:hypothetical protein
MIPSHLSIIMLFITLLSGLSDVYAEQSHSFNDPKTGLSFTLPAGFVISQYRETPNLQPNVRALLPHVIVLAERRLHPTNTPITIGSIPAISLDILTGERAKFNKVFLTPQFETNVNGRLVYELPATKGPITQHIYYYLVPLANGTIIEIAGHRYYFKTPHDTDTTRPTHYDTVIADIIRSLRLGTSDDSWNNTPRTQQS